MYSLKVIPIYPSTKIILLSRTMNLYIVSSTILVYWQYRCDELSVSAHKKKIIFADINAVRRRSLYFQISIEYYNVL